MVLVSAGAAAGDAPRPLRVVTFNLLHGGASSGLSGDGQHLEARLAMVVEELRRLAPDVVALQEASVGRGRGNVAARIAAALGYHYAHAPATSRVFGIPPLDRLIVATMNFSEGPAVLSRFPIEDFAVHDLPRCVRFFDPRVALHAVVRTSSGPMAVVSTHLSHDGCQARRVGEIAQAGRTALPTVVMGDFNAGETTPWIDALVRERGFVDVFRAAHPGAPGSTVWQRIDAEQRMAIRRVDYVFMLAGTAYTARVLDSRVVLDHPRRVEGATLWPSDHYGVLAELAIVPVGAAAR